MDALDASPLGGKINMQTWDDDKQVIHVHSAVGNLATRAEVAAYLPDASFDITPDKYSRKALVSSAESVGNAALATGLKIAATPNLDNSGLRVSVGQASDVALLKPLLQGISFPVTTKVGGRTYKNISRLSDSASFYGGTRIYRQTSTGVTICTLGFKVQKEPARQNELPHIAGWTAQAGTQARGIRQIILSAQWVPLMLVEPTYERLLGVPTLQTSG